VRGPWCRGPRTRRHAVGWEPGWSLRGEFYDGPLDDATILSTCSLFQGSSPDDFTPILPSLSRRRYREGEYIWHIGDPADEMSVVITGEVLVSSIGADGDQFILEAYVRGDTIGQLPFFEPAGERLFDATAGRDTECLVATRHAVLALLRARPQLMIRMLSVYSKWIRTRDVYARDAAFQNLSGRVACKLVELANRYGETSPDGVLIPIRLTQETVANMLGASRENVSRALARLTREGEVRRKGGSFLIPKLALLADRYSAFLDTPLGLASRPAPMRSGSPG
jgi:CRP/FNR family cyclic AMP-dependent transcriptional regulator